MGFFTKLSAALLLSIAISLAAIYFGLISLIDKITDYVKTVPGFDRIDVDLNPMYILAAVIAIISVLIGYGFGHWQGKSKTGHTDSELTDKFST